MLYEDDKILTIDEYEKVAREYLKAIEENKIELIKVEDDSSLIEEVLHSFACVSRSLFCLGGFLNTSRLYSLTCKQIKTLQEIYNCKMPQAVLPSYDKTKLFLHFVGCESGLILSLNNLAKSSNNAQVLEKMINDRLILCKNIFMKNK